MTTMHNLGLPAAECSKLTAARPLHEHRAAAEDVVRATTADAAAVTAAARRRPPNHLSGFARA
jgi:hypothetical protein